VNRESWTVLFTVHGSQITRKTRVGSAFRRPALWSEEIMTTNLSNLRAPKKANTGRKRVGRGMGSGMGKTSTRGHKGQGSRSGFSLMPLEDYPKLGLVSSKKALIKVLGSGELKAAITVHAHKFSKSAIEKIEKAGGKAVVLGGAVAEKA
jgi:large subunit ribosomal protein L15